MVTGALSLSIRSNELLLPVYTCQIPSLSIAAIADYVGIRSMELIFGPTVAEHAITVTVIDDSALEHTESFHVVLSSDVDQIVNFLDQQATVWILDDDGEH